MVSLKNLLCLRVYSEPEENFVFVVDCLNNNRYFIFIVSMYLDDDTLPRYSFVKIHFLVYSNKVTVV